MEPARAARLALLTAAFAALTAASVSAETLMMPSRDMVMGTAQVVWGVTTLPNHTTASPTTYSINFGDGSANATGNVTDRSYIAVTHTFTGSGTFTATLQVTNGNTTESAIVPLRVFDSSAISAEQLRGVRINSAIEDGLRYLWVNQTSRAANFPAAATTTWPGIYPESFAALVVLAFENHGYLLPNSDAAPDGVYQKYIVRRGLNYVIDRLRQITLTAQAAGDPCVNVDDAPAPCVGLWQNLQQEGYATALAILPLAASNALTRHVAEITGTQNAGYVVGKTYGEVLQRLVDATAWGQLESGFSRGGWGYTFNSGTTDGSIVGWNVLALLDAAAAGSNGPGFVKTEFANFAIPFGLNSDGTFDYTPGNNPAVAQGAAGANMAKNGIGVQAMYYADMIGVGDPRVLAARNAISNRWNAPVAGDNYPCANNTHNKGCGYAMFNVFKALKLQGITTLPGVNRPAGPGDIPAGDWYADYVDWLLANQTAPTTTAGGDWQALSFSCCGAGDFTSASAALAELILSPVALITPDPTLFSTIGLGPTTALLAPGGTHTVTATATSIGGAPVPGATVRFSVLTGPNAGATGSGVTNAAGQTTFTYTDGGGAGRDTIRAFIGSLGSNTVEALWQVPTCTGASAGLQTPMYPLDQGWRRVVINGVSGATVTQVCQDEAPNFENVPAWAVDADGVGTSALSVRAQRSGTRTAPGNGRVYHIYFTASSCSGQVTVGVPTTAAGIATDDGALYNSVTGATCTPPVIPDVVITPSFVGKTPAVAAALAAAAGVQLTIASLTSQDVPAGVIISQLPGAGSNVAHGSSIVITVSVGKSAVTVPDVVGKPQSTATTQVSDAGLSPTISGVNDPQIAAGLVISQAPLAGTQVPPGSGVSLTVSLGAAVSTVPNLVALDLAGAMTAIGTAGLNLGTANSVYDATIAEGVVISQSPTGGATVGLGTTVNIVFSLGPQPAPVPVPSVVGLTEAQALANIAAASLVVGTIARVADPTVNAGYVISQTPANTSTALPGSIVDLTVSIGPAGSGGSGPPGSNPPPTVSIESPASGAQLETDVQVIGSVQDTDLREWSLEYGAPGTGTWNRIGSGTAPVTSGVLGTFPATLAANGPVRIRLIATDNQQAISQEIEVQVDSKDLKLGDFTLSYEDMRVPAITFPISITRTYDTKRLSTGDFGPGWSLSFTGVDLQRAANNDVYVTLPTGRRVQFKFSPVHMFLFPIYQNRYVGAEGVTDTLETTDCPYLFGGGGVFLCGFFPYDPQDWVLKTTEGLTYTIHSNGGISRIEDRGGNAVDIAPNAITTSWGLTVPITRGAGNRITRIGEPTGSNGITYGYDAAGRLAEVRDQSDQPTTYYYDDARFPNYLTRIVDPLGRPAVRTIFDDAGRLIARCGATADPVTLQGCARFNHDVAARIQTLVDGRGARTDLVMDARGNVVTERRYLDDGTFQDTTREFDDANRLLREFGPTGAKLREYTYDANGNLLTGAGADGRTTTFTYNACNRAATQRDATGHLSTFTYDASCNLVSATGPDGSVTTVTYTPEGQIASLRDGTGSTWRWEYDLNGFPKTVTDAFGKTLQPIFNANGDLVAQIDRNGRRIDFAYDASHRLIRETWNTTPPRVTTYEYWPDGTVRRAADPDSSLQMTYTSTGQVETVDTTGTPGVPNVLLSYVYDKTGNITSVTDSLGASTNYTYDVLNRLATIEQTGSTASGKRVDFSYDAAGLLQRIRRFANVSGTAEVASTSFEYECPGCADRLSAIRNRRIADGATIDDITLQRNDFSDISQIADADGSHAFGYDLARQLVSAQHTTAAPSLETYTYDAVGNRLTSHLLAYGYSPVGNRLVQDDTYFYGYDGEGNLVEQTNRSTGAKTLFTYDYFNRLVSVSQRDGAGAETGRSSYVYDVSDRRIQSNENGVLRRYAYDGVNPFLKFDASGQIVSRRLYAEGADKILADDTGGGTRWFLTDQLGTVRDLVANDGSVLAHYSYDSFGQPVGSSAPAVENDLRFTGREYSASTGLLYLRARYYSPQLGRFISEDPIGFAGRDVNTYRYAQNSPINLFDLSGNDFFEEAELETRIQGFVTAAEECLGKAVFTTIGEAGVYLLFAGEGIPIYPGGDSNVYVGRTMREFAVRFQEHAGKLIGETRSFRVSEEFLAKNPKAFRTIEQLLMDAFGGKASLANKINASRKLFCD